MLYLPTLQITGLWHPSFSTSLTQGHIFLHACLNALHSCSTFTDVDRPSLFCSHFPTAWTPHLHSNYVLLLLFLWHQATKSLLITHIHLCALWINLLPLVRRKPMFVPAVPVGLWCGVTDICLDCFICAAVWAEYSHLYSVLSAFISFGCIKPKAIFWQCTVFKITTRT